MFRGCLQQLHPNKEPGGLARPAPSPSGAEGFGEVTVELPVLGSLEETGSQQKGVG